MDFKAEKKNLNVLLVSVFMAIIPVAADQYTSPLSIVADSQTGTFYIVGSTAGIVHSFTPGDRKLDTVIDMDNYLSGIALAPDGKTLYVTENVPDGKVLVVDINTRKVIKSLPVGHSPLAPVISPDGKTLYVCNQFNSSVSVLDLQAGKESTTITVGREPVAATITNNGDMLFVANLLPSGPADADYVAASVSAISTKTNHVIADIILPNGSTGLRGICVSPDDKYVYVVHILGRYQVPTTQLIRGWINTNAMSIIDVKTNKLLNCVLLDDVDHGAANPWSVVCTNEGQSICVTHAGTDELSIIDRVALHEKLDKVAAGQKVSDVSMSSEDVPNDLSFLAGIRRRVKLPGKGPRGLVVAGSTAYIAEYFSDSITVVDIDSNSTTRPYSVALAENKPLTAIRRGEMNFNDASLCFQNWQSCTSCHSDSARVDALNWDLLNDGLGNPKNSKSLLYSHQTPPVMGLGVRSTAEVAVRAGIRHVLFATYQEEDAQAIDEYLKSLRPLPSPRLVNGKLSPAAKRGKNIFEQAKCAKCHSGPLYTDLKAYNVGTGLGGEKDTPFDTPTLIETWRTAPYLHDGRAYTMKDVLTKYNPDDKHGRTSQLTDEQINDLMEFILSL